MLALFMKDFDKEIFNMGIQPSEEYVHQLKFSLSLWQMTRKQKISTINGLQKLREYVFRGWEKLRNSPFPGRKKIVILVKPLATFYRELKYNNRR